VAEEAKKRLPELDLLRVMALLGVLVIHAGAWITPAEAPVTAGAMAVVSSLARFCVPAFVFASGFALFHAYRGRRLAPGAFLRKRWLRTLLPWACCAPLFLALDFWRRDPAPEAEAVGRWLLQGGGHLYFLLLIAQLYLVFVLLTRVGPRLAWTAAGLVALQLALMAWRSYAPAPPGWLTWPGIHMAHEEAPFWAGTFALGCIAAAEWPRLAGLSRWWPLAVLAAVVTGCLVLGEGQLVGGVDWRQGNAAYLWPSRLAQTVSWCLAVLWIGQRLRAPGALQTAIGRLSQHSLGLYVLHPIVLDALGPRTGGLLPPIRVLLLIAAALAGAYVAVRLLAHTRLTAAALGEQRAPVPPRLPLAA
jgi:surface polysaccharide O-acyltransferase-like enzyme